MPCTVSSSISASLPWPAADTLPLGDLGADHQVAEHALLGLFVDQARPQLVHREGEHVGRTLLLHPLLVELGDGRLVDGLDAQLGLRVHPHHVDHEPAQPGQLAHVEVVTGLVEHLDAQSATPASDVGVRWGVGHGVARSRRWSRCAASSLRASNSSYAATILPTSRCRTTSWAVSRWNETSSTPSRMLSDDLEPGLDAARQVDLGDVAGHHDPRAEARGGSGTSSSARAWCSAPRRG